MKDVKKFFIEYFFNFRKFFSVSVAGIICFVLIVVMLISSSFLYSSYSKAKETEAKISEMQSFLVDWQCKVDQLNGSELRPVSPKDLDDIQATLLFKLQNSNLKLNSFKALNPSRSVVKEKAPATESGKKVSPEQEQKNKKKEMQNTKHDFEIEFEGEYGPVMQYINEFKAKNALINVQSVELKSKKGIITAILKYRAYTI